MNATSQSYRSCRPIRDKHKKESKELTLEEKERVEEEIRNLTTLDSVISTGQTIEAT